MSTLCELEESGRHDYLEEYDIIFVNGIHNFRRINIDRIPRETKVILWEHGVHHLYRKEHRQWLNRCDVVGFTGPTAYAQKGGFLLEYGVCPYPTKGLTNPYTNKRRNIFYAGRLCNQFGESHIIEYLHAASKLGSLYVLSTDKPPADLKCHYLGQKNHGTFVEYYLYADASLDSAHQPDRTWMNCKVIDCIYYGLPVVVAGPFGGDHWIKESGCGIVTEERSLDQFNDAMREVLDDPWRFRYAQKRLDESLTWEERFKACWVTRELINMA
jgi:hypothetical protein